ncbi:DUF3741 domain-containing protein/DUF4378 domain-containing protein/VARLMGL domain-containing protein [Cephalotus follicularis]|uniref:DUF3741 domain-containing protein/DUF4378 domain-containing protein/VARLMGL domain-containing protein n=1 Tax=Cephalotus follicularis TaxID=3775 RepID=A0A1Q3B3Y4_CEPFO|nr:DUF3741 domain-containing protein/DUF4378 domain-containing protein/VARLMGL domain-containing protein [Cephalotus follicularis]
MEVNPLRRSKITSIANRSPDDSVALPEGNGQVQKLGHLPKLATDFSTCNSGTKDQDSVTFELGARSSNRAVGTPMKKLLAAEMSRETEPKKRSPSIIARLMGLDVLPPQQPAHKPHKRSTENYQQRMISVDKAQRSIATSGRRSFKKSSKEEQEFKDVFEVLDASNVENSSFSSQGTANSNQTEAEMAFIRQKFMDAKRLSTDEKLQDLKEFHDALEVLDSNKDLLLKYLQHPDSLFAKHLHDLQGAHPQSLCGRTLAMRSSHAPQTGHSGLRQKTETETPWKNHSKSPQKRHAGLVSDSYSRLAALDAHKSSKAQLDGKADISVAPTRIVVLKPNLGKNATRTTSSTCSSYGFQSDCSKRTELPGITNREVDIGLKKKVPEDVGLSRHNSRESREMAKEITRQMRESFSSGSMKFSASRFRGFEGDECSRDRSAIETANLTSRGNMDRNNGYRSSSSLSTESSVSREAKKRLSERWIMTHKSQDVRMVNRGSTLGEMLAIPDRDVRPENMDPLIVARLGSNCGSAGWVEPLGISSRDGWKDGCISELSRSRSLPASSTAFGSPKASFHRKTFYDDRYMMPKDATKRGRKKSLRRNSDQRESQICRKSKSSHKNSRSLDTSPEIHFSHSQVESNFKKDMPSENLIVSETSFSLVTDRMSVPEMDVGHLNITMSSESPIQDSADPMLASSDLSTGGLYNSSSQEQSDGKSEEVLLHHPVSDLKSPSSSKEADQPSPVSILEAPFTDDLSSSSECFESLSADLHGLRMQLQLLKLESEIYEEGFMQISSDEDAGEGSVGFPEYKGINRVEENWELSYIVDVLIDSGLNNADPDKFLVTRHSPECPVSPSVFEELEKKYSQLNSWSKSDRKLMFDRINMNLLMIYCQFTDPHPWVKLATRIGPKLSRNGLEDTLHRLLLSQDKEAKKDLLEKDLERESQWLELRDDIDVIGRDIERFLIDDLVAELVAV